MLCPKCFGSHLVVSCGRPAPCPECQGVGEIHCCDGLVCQPGPADEPAEAELAPAAAPPA